MFNSSLIRNDFIFLYGGSMYTSCKPCRVDPGSYTVHHVIASIPVQSSSLLVLAKGRLPTSHGGGEAVGGSQSIQDTPIIFAANAYRSAASSI